MLQLNHSKTEAMVFTKKSKVSTVSNISLHIGTLDIKPSLKLRNLGAFFDPVLSMDSHVNTTCQSCYFHLRKIGQIRQYVSTAAAKSLVNSLVTSRIDYANALLYGVTGTLFDKLQRVQNLSARIVARVPKRAHIQPILKELHWLPVRQRVVFKTLLLTFSALHGLSPSYICDMLEIYKPSRSLRSEDSVFLKVPVSKSVTYGDNNFLRAAPLLWNSLPQPIRECLTIHKFKRTLKTHLFKEAFTDY